MKYVPEKSSAQEEYGNHLVKYYFEVIEMSILIVGR
jgi:hypothetical protein